MKQRTFNFTVFYCINLYNPDLFLQSARAGILDFKPRDLIRSNTGVVYMQRWYFLLSHCVEKVCISWDLFVINYSSEKLVKENTSLSCSAIFLVVKLIFFHKKFES